MPRRRLRHVLLSALLCGNAPEQDGGRDARETQGRKEDALAEKKTSMLLHMSQAFPCPSPFDSTRGHVSNVCVCRDVPPTRMYAAVRQEAEDLWNSHCKNTPRMQKAALAAEREQLRRHAQDETQREEPLRRG